MKEFRNVTYFGPKSFVGFFHGYPLRRTARAVSERVRLIVFPFWYVEEETNLGFEKFLCISHFLKVTKTFIPLHKGNISSLPMVFSWFSLSLLILINENWKLTFEPARHGPVHVLSPMLAVSIFIGSFYFETKFLEKSDFGQEKKLACQQEMLAVRKK